MTKIHVRIDYDWISGYLKYGHKEGILELEDKDYEEFKKDPETFLRETGAYYGLKFVVDNYSLEDWGESEVTYCEED